MNYNNFAKCIFLTFVAVVLVACAASLKTPSAPTQDAAAVVDSGTDSEVLDLTDAGILGTSSTSLDASTDVSHEAGLSEADIKFPFVEYVFNAMKEWVPPISQCYWDPDKTKYQKCIDDVEEHHSLVAQTIVDVVTDPSVTLPIAGNNNKVKSALLMASIAKDESHYSKKVDECVVKGDHGASIGLWQTLVLDWPTRSAICKDRNFALRYAIKVVNTSFDICKGHPFQDKLTTYACGFCSEPTASEEKKHKAWTFGQQDSRRKTNRAIDYLKVHPFEFQ